VSEDELRPPIIAWLHEAGFDPGVFQEVEIRGDIADMVAVAGPRLAVVELKLQLSFELLHQARRWRGLAHQVFVGVPYARPSEGRRMAFDVFDTYGIGVLEVTEGRWSGQTDVEERVRPAFNRNARTDMIRRKLCEEQKTFAAAGSPTGRRWSPFKATCKRVADFVREHPGATPREMIEELGKLHYASDAGARSRLLALIRRGVVDGVRLEQDGRRWRLYPV